MLGKNSPAMRQQWIMDMVFISLILLCFYCFCLGSYPLFTRDEGRYCEVAREMIVSGDYITPRVDGVAFLDKPVLYYWLQATAMLLFGIKEWALRLFPVLFGVFGCVMTYVCGRRLFDRRTGLISAFILAVTPLYFAGAHYANLDLEIAALISTTLLFFITGVQSKGNARNFFLIFAYVFAALAFLTKGLIGIVFPAMIGGLWIIFLSQWKQLTRIHLIKGLILFALIVFPWYYLVQRANPEFLHYFFVTQQVTRFLSTASFNNPIPFWFYLPIVLIGFIPWAGLLIPAFSYHFQRIFNARHSHQTELFLLIWVFSVFIFFSIPHSKVITYILPIFPALALLTGNYLSSAWDSAQVRGMKTGIACMILMSMLFALFLFVTDQYTFIDIPSAFIPALEIIASIFVLHAILLIIFFRQKSCLNLFLTTIICNIFVLSTLLWNVHILNQYSAKPLVNLLKNVIQPDDEVINYFKFYQDIPLYLEKRITLVAQWNSPKVPYHDNWIRELWYGMPFQNTSDWLIEENTFWQKWKSNKRVFVFLGENYFDQFKTHTSEYYILGENNEIILLSNKPTHFLKTKF